MAVTKNGILGSYEGKIGPIVGSSWRGIPYIKNAPVRKKAPGQKELENRYIFKFTQEWIMPIKTFLKQGFRNYSQTNFGINAAKSFLYKHALIKDGMDSRIDPSRMQISYGDLPLPENIQIEWAHRPTEVEENGKLSTGELTVTWDVPNHRSTNDFDMNDQVMLLAYDVANEDVHGVLHEAFRKTGRQTIPVDYLPDSEHHVWVAFVSVDRERQSHSVYMGTIVNGELQKSIEKQEVGG